MTKKVLIITAHPDDAEICMGGLILKLIKNDYKVKITIISVPDDKKRVQEAKDAAEFMGVELDILKDNKQVSDLSESDLVKITDSHILSFKPDIVFTHWEYDSHVDHRYLYRAVQASSRIFPFSLFSFGPPNINSLNFFDFKPNFYSSISLEEKIKAIKYHNTQITAKSYPLETPKIINRIYGKYINSSYAEGFIVVRYVH